MTRYLAVDFGSTFTKAALVEAGTGVLLGTTSHPTTLATDVLDGFRACREQLGLAPGEEPDLTVLACSSAGGGLRIAVVGNEELVTAEAGRRVALSSGGTVVGVHAWATDGPPTPAALEPLRPDVVLLVGGTDGGNPAPLLACAEALRDWSGPVVLAGNTAAAPQAVELLTAAGVPVTVADNVVPRIGVLVPEPARVAIREVFLRHVIGGKHLSASTDFTAMVRGATPDVVLRGVELLARGTGEDDPGVGDVVVVDVGGATTDVHSVVEPDPDQVGREVVATAPVSRTVEGDLGMRWSAPGVVAAAGRDDLAEEARRRAEDPAFLPGTAPDPDHQARVDEEIATLAVTEALRRHAGRSQVVLGPDGRVVVRTGQDLREVELLVGSGGVLRHAEDGVAERVLSAACAAGDGGWQLPEQPRRVVDADYVLAAAGLIGESDPVTAHRLVQRLLVGRAG